MNSANGYIHYLFGQDQDILTMWHMVARSWVVYLIGIILLRIDKRFMELRTGFNFFN